MSSNMIKPYGDTLNDGVMQLSFTLPIEDCARAKKAAEEYLLKLNLEQPQIVFSEKLTNGFTYFVAYAKAKPVIDYDKIVASEVETQKLDFYQINDLIKEKINRKIVVVGATIGDDAHTVGIDAIMNMKGFNGDYGLERYPEIDAINLGAQIPPEVLLERAVVESADVILVSQTVTQKDAHIRNFTAFMELLEAEKIRNHFIVIAGGPRISNDLAKELGYDAGFGPGTLASNVASYFVNKVIEKNGV